MLSQEPIQLVPMPFYILQNEPIAPALRRIAHEQIGIVLSSFADDTVPVAQQVHALRTRCKKMRGLLRLPRPLLGDMFDVEDQRFRAAAKQLALYRDAEVLTKTIKSLGGSGDAYGVRRIPIPAAAIDGSLEIMAECQDAVDNWPLEIRDFNDLVPGLSRTYQKCLDAWDATQRDPSDTNFHSLRKMTKYHWYQVRILERLNKAVIRERRRKLHDLQLTLGCAHDLAVLQAFLECQDDLESQLLHRAIKRKRELYGRAKNLGDEVYETSIEDLIADSSPRSTSNGRSLQLG